MITAEFLRITIFFLFVFLHVVDTQTEPTAEKVNNEKKDCNDRSKQLERNGSSPENNDDCALYLAIRDCVTDLVKEGLYDDRQKGPQLGEL
ncbi:hypothetical protein DdX_20820 [Ditylenchus destructor]|uniref:Uncharacterized protein n=1 Tax=Ditylenchus destructor TaxID=166010 RepID=A0AAD4QW80_9BILA|nr:hypothetical protein DdX_20820 [Ditylenchus destructor]